MSTASDLRQDRVSSAPYVAFTTFKNFIKSLSENGVPSHVDKSVMNGLSGGVQSHLASAIKFLGLVEDDLTPTADLQKLVDSFGSDDWKDCLATLIKSSYMDVTDGIDLENATPNQLDKCFDNQSAVMLDKTVRFYLAALDDAGVEYSAHLKKRKPKAKRKPRAGSRDGTKTKKSNESDTTKKQSADSDPSMIEYPIHFAGNRTGHIRVPGDITTEDCDMIELVIPMLKMLAQRNAE